MKKIILLSLILLFSLAGCNKSNSKNEFVIPKDTEFHYSRTNVEWPSEMIAKEGEELIEEYIGYEFFDGNLYLYTDTPDREELGGYHVYILSKDTLKWEKTDITWNEIGDYDKENDLFDRSQDEGEVCVANTTNIWHGLDGEIYFIVYKMNFKGLGSRFKILCLKDGEASEVNLGDACKNLDNQTKDESSMGWFIYEKRYLLFPYSDGSIHVFDLIDKNETLEWEMGNNQANLRLSFNGLYQVENDEVNILDFRTGELDGTLKCDGLDLSLDDPIGYTWDIYEGNDKLYYISKDGIYGWSMSMDTEREQLVESNDMFENDAKVGSYKYIEAYFVDNDENIYVKYASHVLGTSQTNNTSDEFGKIVVYLKE